MTQFPSVGFQKNGQYSQFSIRAKGIPETYFAEFTCDYSWLLFDSQERSQRRWATKVTQFEKKLTTSKVSGEKTQIATLLVPDQLRHEVESHFVLTPYERV
jgi:hypothetical protein